MSFTLPEGLAPEVYPLAWLVGRWQGEGVVVYPTIPEAPVTQEVVVTHDGGPYLAWSSTLRLAPDPAAPAPDPVEGRVWATESGFWRVPPDRPADLPADRHPVELLLTDPAGHLTLYAGVTGNGRIDLASDLIARTPDAAEISAATRLLGLVEGDLLWTWDIAAFGQPLQSYASARLRRVA
ncbi:MAG TPA: FABP family protein [Actinotalea sp.]